MNLRYMNTRDLVKNVIVAVIYAAITYAFSWMAYGQVQFRISEVLVLLAFINRKYIPGLVLGCVLANLYSPFGIVDVVFGSLATYITVYLISRTKNLFIASLWPTVNSIFVGVELWYFLHTPIWINTLYVAFGEFVVVTLVGYPLFKLLMKNESLMKELKN